jgi:hypothetical protein
MPENKKMRMSPKDTRKDVYNEKPYRGCSCSATCGIWNYPSRIHIDAMIVEESEIDTFLQFLGIVYIV